MMSEVRQIVRDVAAWTNVPAARIMSRDRTPRVLFARREVIRRLRKTGRSLFQIARLVERDHSTVHHALQKIETGMPWRKPRVKRICGKMCRRYPTYEEATCDWALQDLPCVVHRQGRDAAGSSGADAGIGATRSVPAWYGCDRH